MISAAEIPIGGPIGRADIDMSDACVNLELLFGTDFSDDERVLTSTTGSESNMAGDDEQVLHLRWALEFLETYDTVLLLLLAQLHIRNQSVSPHKPQYYH